MCAAECYVNLSSVEFYAISQTGIEKVITFQCLKKIRKMTTFIEQEVIHVCLCHLFG